MADDVATNLSSAGGCKMRQPSNAVRPASTTSDNRAKASISSTPMVAQPRSVPCTLDDSLLFARPFQGGAGACLLPATLRFDTLRQRPRNVAHLLLYGLVGIEVRMARCIRFPIADIAV